MDILNKRAVEITSLAMNGLAARHKAISSNIANAESKDYKRVDVAFEDQLKKIIDTEERKEKYKLDNMFGENKQSFAPSQYEFNFADFNPNIIASEEVSVTGNNVNVEREMAELSKNGMKYNALAVLQQKAFQGMKDVIRGGGAR